MGEVLIPILAIVGVFATNIIFIYMFFSSRHRERMALIESGADASIFRIEQGHNSSLKFGIVAVMAGIGVLLGNILDNAGLEGVVAYFSMVLIFGGIGLMGYYFYVSRKDNKDLVVS